MRTCHTLQTELQTYIQSHHQTEDPYSIRPCQYTRPGVNGVWKINKIHWTSGSVLSGIKVIFINYYTGQYGIVRCKEIIFKGQLEHMQAKHDGSAININRLRRCAEAISQKNLFFKNIIYLHSCLRDSTIEKSYLR